ncbi:MAG: hypothetical protein JW966_02190 [Anaerolineae bacterium]|nr:hypothetical protein [Anaerolineae bacterium]
MSDVDALIQKAVDAYKTDRKEEAREILMEVVEQDEHNEQAWLWLSAMVDSLEEQQICLENVLTINPDNDRAKKGLDVVSQKLAARSTSTSSNSSIAPSKSPPAFASPKPSTGSSAPIGAEFASASGDSLFSDAEDLPAVSGFSSAFDAQHQPAADDSASSWFAPTPEQPKAPSEPAVPPPSSSVDWNKGQGVAAHGSGKQVNLPSSSEYDDWVRGLNLDGLPIPPGEAPGGAAADAASPFVSRGAAGPFGDTSFMAESDLFSPSSDSRNQPDAFADAYESPGEAAPWDDSLPDMDSSQSGFESPASVFNSHPSAPVFEPGTGFGQDNVFVDEDGSSDLSALESSFPFDDEEEIGVGTLPRRDTDENLDVDWLDRLEGSGDEVAPVFAAADASSIQAEQYYQYIPAEIEPKAGGLNRESLMMLGGIVLLSVLNLVSIIVFFNAL